MGVRQRLFFNKQLAVGMSTPKDLGRAHQGEMRSRPRGSPPRRRHQNCSFGPR